MPILNLVDVSFSYNNVDAVLSKINLTINPGCKFAIIGENGSGKSTLADLIRGKLIPTSGIIKRNNFQVVYLPQNSELINQNLSPGEQQTQKIFESFRSANDADCLILDEPTNHLDWHTKVEVLKKISQNHQFSLIIISHDRDLLYLMDEIYEIKNSKMIKFGGNYEFYKKTNEIEANAKKQYFENISKEQKKLAEQVAVFRQRQDRRNRKGKSDRKNIGLPKILLNARKENAENTTAKLSNIWKSRVETLGNKVSIAKSDLTPERHLNFEIEDYKPPYVQQNLITCYNLNVSTNLKNLWDKSLNFSIYTSQRVLISGKNGAGKTTLLELLAGNKKPSTGDIQKNYKSLYYLRQLDKIHILPKKMSLLEIVLGNDQNHQQLSNARLVLGHFGFRGQDVFRNFETLSGGEQTRLKIAMTFLAARRSEIIFLDEPTNHLDLQTLEMFEEALNGLKKSIVVVSHDPYFIRKIKIDDEIQLSSTHGGKN